MGSRISVIIPVLNEEVSLPLLLDSLVGQRHVHEIIVSDGGSIDKTKEVCDKFHVIWVSGYKGKASQMNAGARLATGDIFLFLHADSIMSPGALDALPALLETAEAGTFRMKFDRRSPLLRWYAGFTRINTPLFLYGDQGLFIRAEVFQEIGGYTEMPFLEDVDIIQKLIKRGNLVKSDEYIQTSARRFEANGILRQQIKNIIVVMLFRAGMSPEYLKRFYPYH